MRVRGIVWMSVGVIILSEASAYGNAFAGENPNVRLAMHCAASNAYLGCPDRCPQSCDEIDCDLTPQELSASGDRGIIYLVAYNVTGFSGIEFALEVTPHSGVSFENIHWCAPAPLAPHMGDPWREGVIVTWGNDDYCLEPRGGEGGVVFGYLRIDFTGMEPVILKYAPSSFSYSFAPRNYVLDCTDSYAEDRVVAAHGAVIGGNASAIGSPCDGGPSSQMQSWSEVKSMYKY